VVRSEPGSQIDEIVVDNDIVSSGTNLIVKNTNGGGDKQSFTMACLCFNVAPILSGSMHREKGKKHG